jgi:hypothetical protein
MMFSQYRIALVYITLVVSHSVIRAEPVPARVFPTRNVTLQQEGRLYVTAYTLHVRMDIDLSHFADHCDVLRNQTVVLTQKLHDTPTGKHSAWDPAVTAAGARLKLVCDDIANLMLDEHGEPKRFAGVAIAAAAAFGLYKVADLLGLWGGADAEVKAQIDHHQHQLKAMQKAIANQQTALDRMRKAMGGIWDKLLFDQMLMLLVHSIDMLESHAQNVLRGVTEARQGHLSEDLVPYGTAAHLVRELKKGREGFPVSSPLELYQFPVSLGHTRQGLLLFLHIPIVVQQMNLWWLRHTAVLHRQEDASWQLRTLRHSHQFVATSRNELEFVLGDPADLRHCLRIRRAYFCKDFVARRDKAATCLSALAFNLQSAIAKHCDWVPSNRSWEVLPMDDGAYIVASTVPLDVATRCAGGSSRGYRLDAGYSRIPMSKGCVTSTPHFSLYERPDQEWAPKAQVILDGGVDLGEVPTVRQAASVTPEFEEVDRDLGEAREASAEAEDAVWGEWVYTPHFQLTVMNVYAIRPTPNQANVMYSM